MICVGCGAEVPAGARFCQNCGAELQAWSTRVDTGGGAFIRGSVHAGHDFVGRDQTAQQGLGGEDIARLFEAVYARVERPTGKRKAKADEVRETVQRVEQEVSKGDEGDTERIERWLRALADIAPDVLEVAVTAMTNPWAAVASGVKMVAKRFQRFSGGAAETTKG